MWSPPRATTRAPPSRRALARGRWRRSRPRCRTDLPRYPRHLLPAGSRRARRRDGGGSCATTWSRLGLPVVQNVLPTGNSFRRRMEFRRSLRRSAKPRQDEASEQTSSVQQTEGSRVDRPGLPHLRRDGQKSAGRQLTWAAIFGVSAKSRLVYSCCGRSITSTVLPNSTIRPSAITATRSAIDRTRGGCE